jgi:hypothetical protein
MADQITNVGSFGGSEKGEVSKRGQGAQEPEPVQPEAEKTEKKDK